MQATHGIMGRRRQFKTPTDVKPFVFQTLFADCGWAELAGGKNGHQAGIVNAFTVKAVGPPPLLMVHCHGLELQSIKAASRGLDTPQRVQGSGFLTPKVVGQGGPGGGRRGGMETSGASWGTGSGWAVPLRTVQGN